jgi:hypothetical protein
VETNFPDNAETSKEGQMFRYAASFYLFTLFFFNGCVRRDSADTKTQIAASSAFDWGHFIMSIIPVNISDSPDPDSDPQICLFEVNWDYEWPSNPKMWPAIYAKHINTWSFDKSYIRNYNANNPNDVGLFKELLSRFNVACGATAFQQICRLPALQEANFIKDMQSKLQRLFEKRRIQRSKEFAMAIDVADVLMSQSTDYVKLLTRTKKLRSNHRYGKNCLNKPFDLQKEHKRLEDIGKLLKGID